MTEYHAPDAVLCEAIVARGLTLGVRRAGRIRRFGPRPLLGARPHFERWREIVGAFEASL